MRKILLAFIFALCLDCSAATADWQKPEVRISNAYRYLVRERHSIYIQRGEIDFSYQRDSDRFSKFLFSPFIELHNNLQTDRLERKETGLEVGTDITPWFYIGESLQYTRYNYDWTDYIWHPRIKYAAEAETRIMFSLPVGSIGEDKKIRAFLLDEYTYSFRLTQPTRNELSVGVKAPLMRYLQGSFAWRHIDRIHDFDSDALEATLTLVF